jgi:hypothetical protein
MEAFYVELEPMEIAHIALSKKMYLQHQLPSTILHIIVDEKCRAYKCNQRRCKQPHAVPSPAEIVRFWG